MARLALLLVLLLTVTPAAAEPWAERYWNPKPEADDRVLPLPCEGRMAFRWIATPTEGNWLADRQVFVGRAAEEASFGEFAHLDHLVGSLAAGDPAARGYWLGKYEVTEAQYLAVMEETCPQVSDATRRPAASLSWFDAVAFSRRWTEWLLTQAPDALPREGGATAFVRLPTETEWEYALRGGAAVTDSAFRAPLFPTEGEITDYAWLQGATSCSGKPRPVGLLKPNPLGLYDMLGNVDEMVLEAYRANRAGRPHGQPGGLVARGGSCLIAPGQIRSSLRLEVPFFNAEKGQATALSFLGFRVAVAAPVVTDAARLAAMTDDWQAALAARTFGEEGADPLAVIEEVAAETGDLQARDALQQSLVALRTELGARNEAEARALQSLLLAGASLGQQYLVAGDRMRRLEESRGALVAVRDGQQQGSQGWADYDRLVQQLDKGLAEQRPGRDLAGAAYLELLLQIAGDVRRDPLQAQLRLVEERLGRLAAQAVPGAGGSLLADVARCLAAQALAQSQRGLDQPIGYLAELDVRLAGVPAPAGVPLPDSGCTR